jgi:hypothetical protein
MSVRLAIPPPDSAALLFRLDQPSATPGRGLFFLSADTHHVGRKSCVSPHLSVRLRLRCDNPREWD